MNCDISYLHHHATKPQADPAMIIMVTPKVPQHTMLPICTSIAATINIGKDIHNHLNKIKLQPTKSIGKTTEQNNYRARTKMKKLTGS